MASAPYCNVSIATPAANPAKPLGLQQIPRGATPSQITSIVNNNFSLLIKGNYYEQPGTRQTVITRIFDSSGSGAYVDVKQITSLTFINPLTGQLIQWAQ